MEEQKMDGQPTAAEFPASDLTDIAAQSPSTVVAVEKDAPLVAGRQFSQAVFTTPASIHAWRTHVQSLTPQQRELFLRFVPGSMEDFSNYVAARSRQHGDKSWLLKINDLVRPFFRTVGMYISMAAVASQATASPSSIVIGGIACVLQVSENLGKYQDLLLDWLLSMSAKVSILMEYDICIYQYDDRIQDALVNIYGDILEFCQKAASFCQDGDRIRSGLKIFGKSLVQTFHDTFGGILKNFETHLEKYQALAGLCNAQRLKQFYFAQLREAEIQSQFRDEQRQLGHESSQFYQEQRQFDEEQRAFYQEQRDFNDQLMDSFISTRAAAEAEVAREAAELERQLQDENARRRGICSCTFNGSSELTLITAEKRQKIIDWIPSVSLQTEHDRRNRERLKGTAVWIQESDVYQSWRNSSTSCSLLVKGKPGCGKSILAASTCNQLQSLSTMEQIAVGYFYCSSGDSERNTPSKLWSTVLKQLYLQTQSLEPHLENLYDTRSQIDVQGLGETDTTESLQKVAACFQEVFLLLDGLDECNDVESVLDVLETLMNDTSIRMKTIIFSRPEYLSIENAFKDSLQLRVDMGGNSEDIEKFVMTVLSRREFVWNKTPDLLDEVQSEIRKGAEEVFLWVNLQAGSLKGTLTRAQVMKRLRNLPKGLNESYKSALERLSNNKDEDQRDLALKIIVWVTNAKRPLSRGELLEALAIVPGMKSREEMKMEILPTDAEFVTLCADLVEVNNDGFYQLVHSSLREYLLAFKPEDSFILKDYADRQTMAQKFMGETCLTYLSFDDFVGGTANTIQNLNEIQKENPFLRYSAGNWGHHIREAGAKVPSETVWQFLDLQEQRSLAMQIMIANFFKENICPFPNPPSVLHVLAFFGLLTLAKERPSLRDLRYKEDGFSFVPLDYAIFNKEDAMCLWLLERPDKQGTKDISGLSQFQPLNNAIRMGWRAVVDALIENGYDVNRPEGQHMTRPLVLAAAAPINSWAVEKLIRAGADVNAAGPQGLTPLMHATISGNDKMVEALLTYGCDPNVQSAIDSTALHLAADYGKSKTVELLLKSGAKATQGAYGWSPAEFAIYADRIDILPVLHKYNALLDARSNSEHHLLSMAVSKNSLSAAKYLVDECKLSITSKSDKGDTVLHFAAGRSDEEFIDFILLRAPELLHERVENGSTALGIAASIGNTKNCKALVKHGLKVDDVTKALYLAMSGSNIETAMFLIACGADLAHDSDESSALHYAAAYGLTDLIKPILDLRGNLETPNREYNTVLHVAAYTGNHEFIEELSGAVPNLNFDALNKFGKTPLHLAVKKNHLEAVQILVKKGAKSLADVNKDHAIHYAARAADEAIVEELLQISDVNAQGFSGQTPLYCSAVHGQKSLAALLLRSGADVDIPTRTGNTPLIAASKSGYGDVAELLIQKGADVNAISQSKWSALHVAASTGNKELVMKLLESGCDASVGDATGMTPFLWSVDSGNVEVVDLFLSRNINQIRDQDQIGRTCLHLSAAEGHREMTDKLLAMGADPAILNNFGNSCLYSAVRLGRHRIVERLLKTGAPLDVKGEPKNMLGLTTAARKGFYMVVEEILESGDVPVDQVLDYGNCTALTLAAGTNSVQTVKKLMAAGADPRHRDAYGNNALDYASRHQPTFEAMGDAKIGYTPLADAARRTLIRQSVHRAVQTISTQPFTRMWYLNTLAKCLVYLNNASCLEAARHILSEILFSPVDSEVSIIFACDICYRGLSEHDEVFFCMECCGGHLCGLCHWKYKAGSESESERSCPEGLRVLEELESKSLKVKASLLPILDQDLSMIVRVLRIFSVVETFIDSLALGYEDWESTFNSRATDYHYSNRERPGQVFITTIQEARNLVKQSDADYTSADSQSEADDTSGASHSEADHTNAESQSKAEDTSADNQSEAENDSTNHRCNDSMRLEKELQKLGKCHVFQDDRPFNCKGHEYLRVSEEDYSKIKEDETIMGPDGRVRDEWLRSLLQLVDREDNDDTTTSSGDPTGTVVEERRDSSKGRHQTLATAEASENQTTPTPPHSSQPLDQSIHEQGSVKETETKDSNPEPLHVNKDAEEDLQLIGFQWSSIDGLSTEFDIAFELAELAQPGFTVKFLDERFFKDDADKYSLKVYGLYAKKQ